MQHRIRIALIDCTSSGGLFQDAVATWAGTRIWERWGCSLDVIDAATLASPGRDDDPVPEPRRRMARADAFVLVTPAFAGELPPALRHTIDAAGDGWQARPVALIACGNGSNGTEDDAIDRLRLALIDYHAVSIRNTVSLDRATTPFDESGELPPSHPANGAMEELLAQLCWWAVALRSARAGAASCERAA